MKDRGTITNCTNVGIELKTAQNNIFTCTVKKYCYLFALMLTFDNITQISNSRISLIVPIISESFKVIFG